MQVLEHLVFVCDSFLHTFDIVITDGVVHNLDAGGPIFFRRFSHNCGRFIAGPRVVELQELRSGLLVSFSDGLQLRGRPFRTLLRPFVIDVLLECGRLMIMLLLCYLFLVAIYVFRRLAHYDIIVDHSASKWKRNRLPFEWDWSFDC